MRNPAFQINRPLLVFVLVPLVATGLSACSNSTRMADGPAWSLTGGKNAGVPVPVASATARPANRVAGWQQPASAPHQIERIPLAPIPGEKSAEATAKSQVHASLAPTPTPMPARAPATYGKYAGRPLIEVHQGDSLASIAKAHNVSIASLMFANGLRDAYVAPGQRLVLPPR